MTNFYIPQIPSKTSKTIRFPDNLIRDVESVLIGKDCTFSAFVIAAVKNALDKLNVESEDGQ